MAKKNKQQDTNTKAEREKYIRESDSRVATWSEAKQRAFQSSVERMSAPNPMPEWLEKQFDNAEKTVESWGPNKRKAAGIPDIDDVEYFTPGEWVRHGRFGQEIVVWWNDDPVEDFINIQRVAIIPRDAGGYGYDGNANLVVTAPKMYRFLKTLMTRSDELPADIVEEAEKLLKCAKPTV